uniref:Uncharacterized protein n=1 Tax=Arundo donax TaxID=35708 RepID=A0A0A9GZ03_ARUDO
MVLVSCSDALLLVNFTRMFLLKRYCLNEYATFFSPVNF